MAKKVSSKKVHVYLSDRAVDDLASVEAYSVEKWGKTVANKYLLAFEKFFCLLQENPGILDSSESSKDELLLHAVQRHVAVFVRWNQDILVLTIVHASRDVADLLDDLLPTLRSEVARLIERLP